MKKTPEPQWAWWTIYGEELMNLLKRAYDGEDPDFLYTEAYANSIVEPYKEDEDGS